jgi:hypothetical protein
MVGVKYDKKNNEKEHTSKNWIQNNEKGQANKNKRAILAFFF